MDRPMNRHANRRMDQQMDGPMEERTNICKDLFDRVAKTHLKMNILCSFLSLNLRPGIIFPFHVLLIFLLLFLFLLIFLLFNMEVWKEGGRHL